MTKHPPKAVIFDIGRVIVRLDLHAAFAPLGSLLSPPSETDGNKTPEYIWNAIQADPSWLEWQEGRMMPRAYHEHITQRLGITLGFEPFCEAWNRVLDPQTILGDRLFEALGSGCRLALLSNTDPIHSMYMENHFTFPRHFPVRIYSNHVGASKPSPAIYLAALAALDTKAENALYIDDVEEYAAAARALGMDAIRFENPAQLGAELELRGLPAGNA